MLGFIIGLFIGTFIGVCIMCLCNVASNTDNMSEKYNEDNGNE